MWSCRWVVTICIFSCVFTIQAQDWTVWLYHPDDGLLLHLGQDGDILETRTMKQDDSFRLPHLVQFSPDQQYMVTLSKAKTSDRQRLTLIETDTANPIYMYDLPTPNDITLNQDDKIIIADNAFSADSRQMVFVSFLGGIGWEVHVFDIAQGDITYSLRYDHPQVLAQPYLSSADIPQVAILQDEMLGFYVKNVAGNPSPQGHSYVWFLIADVISETIAYPNANFDTLETGETIYPLSNRRFDADNPPLDPTRLQHNVIYVYQTSEQSRYPSFVRSELDLLQTWFIQSGERVLIEAWEDEIRTRWLIYDRNGREIRNLPKAGYDVTASPDGFLYLTKLEEKAILVHVDTRTLESSGETVWVDEGAWDIVGVTQALGENLLPFAQLENAETPPPFTSDLSPTPFPTPLPLVYVGRNMQIQVADDGYVNLRESPSTDGEVLALLEDGIYVSIVDGPVDAGIYRWWKVELGRREGWLVEEVGETQVLIPRLPIIDDEEAENDVDDN